MPKELGQPNIETPESSDLGTLELKANLNPQQREHLEVLKDKMKRILGDKTKQELAKAGDLVTLNKYKAMLEEILEFLRTKRMKTGKGLSFKTIEELKAVYSPEQIAHNETEVGEDTKVYIGELYPGIFDQLANVEHIYTTFPEGRIMQKEITIGGKTTKELKKELKEKGYKMEVWAEVMMAYKDFKPGEKAEKLDLVVLAVSDLGFSGGATRTKIYEQAQKFGLEIVPPEVGPQLLLQYEDQPMGEYLLVGSKPLAVSSGRLGVFLVGRGDGGRRWLGDFGADDGHWGSSGRWVFARK